MAEPNTSSVTATALLIGAMGPLAGQYALIVSSALMGALWPLSVMKIESRLHGALFLLKIVGTATCLTSAAAWYLADMLSVSSIEALAPVAFVIGALGNGWAAVFDAMRDAMPAFLKRIFKGKADDDSTGA